MILMESQVVKRSNRVERSLENLSVEEYRLVSLIRKVSNFREETDVLNYMNKMCKKYDSDMIDVLTAFNIVNAFQNSRDNLYRKYRLLPKGAMLFLKKISIVMIKPLYRGVGAGVDDGSIYRDDKVSSWTYSSGVAKSFAYNMFEISYSEYKNKIAWTYLNQDIRIFFSSEGFFSEREVVLLPGNYKVRRALVSSKLRPSQGQPLYHLVLRIKEIPSMFNGLDSDIKDFYNEIKRNKIRYSNYPKLKGLMIKYNLWSRNDDNFQEGWVTLVSSL